MIFETRNEEESIAAGEQIARLLPPRSVVLLIGNLGAGKTTLAKGIVQGLGAAPSEEVSSPTFTLIHEYGEPVRVYHIDLYRLDEMRQVEGLGLDDIYTSDAVVLIEWGERFPRLIPERHIQARITHTESGTRRIDVRGLD